MTTIPRVSSRQIDPLSRRTAVRPDVAQRLENLNRLGTWLDNSIRIPGTQVRIGWDSLIGLFPGVGDAVTTLLSIWIIREARALGVSRLTLMRMLGNTAIDGLFGAVPVVGDVFDAFYKSNMRNLRLLQKHLEAQQSDAGDH